MTSWAVNPAPRVLVIGGGYTGQRFATAMAARGARVWLTRRSETAPPAGGAGGLTWLRFDPANGHALTVLPEGLSHVLVTLPSSGDGSDAALDQLLPALRQQPLAWLGYLSTTGVYGDQGGGWVDEHSPTDPGLERSQRRLACEQGWRQLGVPLQVFRLPAIYGPGRSPFADLRAGRARLIHKPGQVFCRIHVDDIVGALLHCLALPPAERPATVILADEAPCPSSETLGYAAHLLGVPLPALQSYATLEPSLSAMARSFWSENRRVDSRLLREQLGYRLRYPTYREGYRACLAEEEAAP